MTRTLVLNGGYLSEAPSGGDRHLLALASALARRADVEGVRLFAPELARRWLPKGVEAWIYPGRGAKNGLAIAWAYLGRTQRVLLRLIFEKLRRHNSRERFVLASPALVDVLPAVFHRWLFGSRIVVFAFHVGDAKAAGRSGRPLQTMLSSLAGRPALSLLRRAEWVVTSTQVVHDELVRLGVSESRLVRQLPIVDREAVLSAAPLPAADVLFVGRLVERKGVFDLIEAARRCDLTFALVGDGEERGELERRIAAGGLGERVRLLGSLADAEVYGLMKGTGVLVLPSYEEGYGLVLAEALLAGTKAVAYALPHYEEVFGDAVVQVPIGDVEALALELRGLGGGSPHSPSPPLPASGEGGAGAMRSREVGDDAVDRAEGGAASIEIMDADGAAEQLVSLLQL